MLLEHALESLEIMYDCSPFAALGVPPGVASREIIIPGPQVLQQSPKNLNLTSIAPSPVNLKNLSTALLSYDSQDAMILLNGFTNGFSLCYSGPRQAREGANLKSVSQHVEVVQRKIEKEIEAGRVAGPFQNPPLQNLQVSSIGIHLL